MILQLTIFEHKMRISSQTLHNINFLALQTIALKFGGIFFYIRKEKAANFVKSSRLSTIDALFVVDSIFRNLAWNLKIYWDLTC